MDRISEVLATPEWWLSVVIAGLLVNLVSAYMKPWTDAVLSRYLTWWANRTSTARAERAIRIAELSRNEPGRLLASGKALYRAIASVWQMIIAMGSLTICFAWEPNTKSSVNSLAFLIGYVLGIFVMLWSTRNIVAAHNDLDEAGEAQHLAWAKLNEGRRGPPDEL